MGSRFLRDASRSPKIAGPEAAESGHFAGSMKTSRDMVTAVLASLSMTAGFAGGVYDSVPIRENERHLIQSSHELEAYFANLSMLYENEPVVSLVRGMGDELRPEPTDDYIEYEFFVLRDPSPNAFALPNGHVYIHTGMLARLEDEAQLAGLIAHELSHVAGHHGIVHNRAAKGRSIAAMVLGGLGGWGSLISVGLQASVFGFSRELEQEADNHAAVMLFNSRYDPQVLPEVFDILAEDYEGLYPRTPSIWSTHPEIRARAQTSRALVRDMPSRERDVEVFELAVFPLRLVTVRDYIQDDYPHTAVALAESLVARYPNEPQLLHLLGDAWQAMGAQSALDAGELSDAAKRRNQRERILRTREQREAELLETPEGQAAFAENLGRAEVRYRDALALNPEFAVAYRGLGEVYERLGRARAAAEAYLRYVQLEPEAADRRIIINRLRSLTEQIKKEENVDEDA